MKRGLAGVRPVSTRRKAKGGIPLYIPGHQDSRCPNSEGDVMGYLDEAALDENNYPPFTAIKSTFGFIPNFYRAQTKRPDLIEAEMGLVNAVLVREGALARRQREYVFLVCSAANLSTYCVTAHCEIVRMLGIRGPDPEQIALDHTQTDLPVEEKALLNFALKLNGKPKTIDEYDVDGLRTYGFSDEQILETVLMVGLAKFANFVAFGLGTVPDFESRRVEELLAVR
jgi:uncharacterized peroxidase-related enzyme